MFREAGIVTRARCGEKLRQGGLGVSGTEGVREGAVREPMKETQV